MGHKRKRNNIIFIAIILITLAFLTVYKSFNLKNAAASFGHLNFYYKDHFFAQTLISLTPNGEQTFINVKREKFLGLWKGIDSGQIIRHSDDLIDFTHSFLGKDDLYLIGIINSTKINNFLVLDEMNNPLPVYFISDTNPTAQSHFTPLEDSKQYFIIPDVSGTVIIKLFDEHNDILEQHSTSFN